MATKRHPHLRKGDTVVIDGVAILLTETPKLAIDKSWICFGLDNTGKIIMKYKKEDNQ